MPSVLTGALFPEIMTPRTVLPVRTKTTVYNCLKSIRSKAGITQAELAKRVGVSRQTIIAMEKGSYTPSLDLALGLAVIFKRPVEEIFNLEPDCPQRFV